MKWLDTPIIHTRHHGSWSEVWVFLNVAAWNDTKGLANICGVDARWHRFIPIQVSGGLNRKCVVLALCGPLSLTRSMMWRCSSDSFLFPVSCSGFAGHVAAAHSARKGRLDPKVLRQRDLQRDLEEPLRGSERRSAVHLWEGGESEGGGAYRRLRPAPLSADRFISDQQLRPC